eukprot:m51a1_g121 putative beta-mannosidase isoform 1 (1148) ;mRNA; r:403952-409163
MPQQCAVVAGRYALQRQIGRGSFGLVFAARSLATGALAAVKLNEYEVLRALAGTGRVPAPKWFGVQDEYRALVMPLLGPSLEDLRRYCGGRLAASTTLHLAVQMVFNGLAFVPYTFAKIECLRNIHEAGYLHCDVKPANFVMGRRAERGRLYLVDFGLSRPLPDLSAASLASKALTGTPAFMSLNVHEGHSASQRDDLESAVFALVFLLRGRLPWSDAVNARSVRAAKRNVEEATRDCPGVLAALLTRERSSTSAPANHTMQLALLLLLALGAQSAVTHRHITHPSRGLAAELNLAGDSWAVRNATSEPVAARVPGCVHEALERAGVIGNVRVRDNANRLEWVGRSDWGFSRYFDAPSDLLDNRKVLLVCDGLDTVSRVSINGVTVGTSDNMFRRYFFDAKTALKNNSNFIEVAFRSASTYARERAAAYPYSVPFDKYTDNRGIVFGDPYRNFVRKEQCNFGWDWGPSTVTSGIWKDIKLVGFSEAIIAEFAPTVTATPDGFDVRARVILQGVVGTTGKVTVTLAGGLTVTANVGPLSDGENVVDLVLSIPRTSVQLWWPNGVGPNTRSLYLVQACFYGAEGESSCMDKKIGFRTAEVVQEPIPGEQGLSFYFRINGVKVWTKGANFIPVDIYETRVTKDDVRWLVESMAEAGMNFVRIWGGGVYQSEDFYELCDELGIMVWADAMFACAMYPRDKTFLDTVAQEVRDNVRRAASHASLAIWAANNENEGAIQWYEESRTNPKLYAVDYAKLYIDTIRPVIASEDPSRPFVPSSPSNMALADNPSEDLYVMRWGEAGSPLWGDVHFYDYNSDCMDVSMYPRPRFSSEYGFQSMPSLQTLSGVTAVDDLDWMSEIMLLRQHHPQGQEQMMTSIQRHFSVPSSQNHVKKFDDLAYVSQINQALCYRAQTEHYRRIQSEQGHTMGAMYWQLNDIWEAPSWSSIEFPGTWKILHNWAKNFFSSFLVSVYNKGDDLFVYVVNDKNASISGSVQGRVIDWESGSVAYTWEIPFTVGSGTSARIQQNSIASILASAHREASKVLFEFAATGTDGSPISADVPFFPTSFAQVALPRAHVTVKPIAVNSRTAMVVLSTDVPAAFVYLQTGVVGRFADNGFILLPGQSKIVEFRSKAPFNYHTFTSTLTFRSLVDTL